jgi:hypothetical protein
VIALEDASAARAALTGLAATADFASLGVDLQAQLLEVASEVSIVRAACHAAELIFARSSEVGPLLQGLGAGLASLGAANAWHGLAVDGRGAAIMNALRRDAGEAHPTGGAWPDPAEDPAPLAQYRPA